LDRSTSSDDNPSMAEPCDALRSSSPWHAVGHVAGLALACAALLWGVFAPLVVALDPSEWFTLVVIGVVLHVLCLRKARSYGCAGGALLITAAVLFLWIVEWARSGHARGADPMETGLGIMWMLPGCLAIALIGFVFCVRASLVSLGAFQRGSERKQPPCGAPGPRCPKCGHSLRGLLDMRCPECGAMGAARDDHSSCGDQP
jgi:hypothetical protein